MLLLSFELSGCHNIVGIIACYVFISSEIYLNIIKCIFCYSHSVSGHKIVYQTRNEPNKPVVYSDLNWARDHNDYKSIIFYLAGNLIIWASCKQSCIFIFSTETIFIAIAIK